MYLSVGSNLINVAGNIIGVFVLRAGVAGVAYPSLIARIFSAAAITALCFREKNEADKNNSKIQLVICNKLAETLSGGLMDSSGKISRIIIKMRSCLS